jgi:H+/Cl- antiporter ClcA
MPRLGLAVIVLVAMVANLLVGACFGYTPGHVFATVCRYPIWAFLVFWMTVLGVVWCAGLFGWDPGVEKDHKPKPDLG